AENNFQTTPRVTDQPPIASPFRVETGPRRFAAPVGDPQRSIETAGVADGQRISQGRDTQNRTVAEQPRGKVRGAQVVWSTRYRASSPRNFSETGPGNPSPRRPELVREPNDHAT